MRMINIYSLIQIIDSNEKKFQTYEKESEVIIIIRISIRSRKITVNVYKAMF